jgi:hypothetical protein
MKGMNMQAVTDLIDSSRRVRRVAARIRAEIKDEHLRTELLTQEKPLAVTIPVADANDLVGQLELAARQIDEMITIICGDQAMRDQQTAGKMKGDAARA